MREGTYYLPKTLVFTAEDSDGKVRARQLYRSEKNQVNMYHTVAVLDGAVYGFGNESMQCTSLEDGKLLWKKAGEDWGRDQQLIIADGLIFALAR
ncbi:MAG TPA: hypothetical protein VM487_05790, partial [Phycisphaerae bacterium]|nr:hypothetical protein [Phycisphaerae bacterium]